MSQRGAAPLSYALSLFVRGVALIVALFGIALALGTLMGFADVIRTAVREVVGGGLR